MNSILEKYKEYPNITEAYEIVKTVEVVHNRQIYRVEVLDCYTSLPIYYSINCWKYNKEPNEMDIFVQYKLPEINQQGPDLALHQALNFLSGAE